MTDWTVDFAFEQWQKHSDVVKAAQHTNEATTRLRAIDTILFEILGWDKTHCETERYCREEGFSDYAMMDHGTAVLIVEAKKSGATFAIPEAKYSALPVGLTLLAKECPEAEKALRQALGYAASEGARYIAITNGHQWILALTFVPNQRLEQRSVFVFESLEAIESRFRGFYDTFGPHAILGNRPADRLLESRKAPAPAKLSASIVNYPLPATRNFIANELYAATAAVLDEVRSSELDPDFLRSCYVVARANNALLLQTREMLMKRLSLDGSLSAATVNVNDLPSLIQDGHPEKPIVVLGKIGHGKSTFLRYLREVKAREIFDRYVQVDIDFLDRPDTVDQVGQYIYNKVEDDLRVNYDIDVDADNMVRGFLHTDLERFAVSYEGRQFPVGSPEFKQAEKQYVQNIRSDRHLYLSKVFRHLKFGRRKDGEGFSIAIFLDNLDRRSDAIQEEAFLRASAMARDWAALVFVCLRPSTFYRSRHFGVLDSVAPRVVTVSSPKTSELVSKRLTYARDLALGTRENRRSKAGTLFSKDVSVELPSTAPFLEGCALSFLRSRELGALFDAVSNGNARDLLAYVHRVITSLHLDTKKIIEKLRSGGYVMPVHEALRAMLFGDCMQYAPDQSVFINLFDIQRADPIEHFTKPLVLRHLSLVSNSHPHYGLLPFEELLSYLCQVGFTEEHSRETIVFLFEKRCIEGDVPTDEWSPEVRRLRLTERGSYMVKGLISKFNYLDAITVDTPIVDPDYRQKITDVFAIKERLERCRVFVDYLRRCVSELHDSTCKTFFDEVFLQAAGEMDSIAKDI